MLESTSEALVVGTLPVSVVDGLCVVSGDVVVSGTVLTSGVVPAPGVGAGVTVSGVVPLEGIASVLGAVFVVVSVLPDCMISSVVGGSRGTFGSVCVCAPLLRSVVVSVVVA